MEQTTNSAPAADTSAATSTPAPASTPSSTPAATTPTLAETKTAEIKQSLGLAPKPDAAPTEQKTEVTDPNAAPTEEPRKYAGKYDSIEAMEEGVKNGEAKITELAAQLNPLSTVLCETKDREAFRMIRKLDENKFKAASSTRQKFADANAKAMGRKMDYDILTAVSGANQYTSGGTAAGMNFALISHVAELIEGANWDSGEITWVITPKVYAKLLQVDEYKSVDYRTDKPLTQFGVKPLMGINFVVSSVLQNAAFSNGGSATAHYTFCYSKQNVGLALGQDIQTDIDWWPDHRGWACVADGTWGAKTIQKAGVLRIEVSGLTAD